MRTVLDAVTPLVFVLEFVLIARALLDWVAADPDNPETAPGVDQARVSVHHVTDPVLVPLRHAVAPVHVGGAAFDLCVPAVLLGLILLQSTVA